MYGTMKNVDSYITGFPKSGRGTEWMEKNHNLTKKQHKVLSEL